MNTSLSTPTSALAAFFAQLVTEYHPREDGAKKVLILGAADPTEIAALLEAGHQVTLLHSDKKWQPGGVVPTGLKIERKATLEACLASKATKQHDLVVVLGEVHGLPLEKAQEVFSRLSTMLGPSGIVAAWLPSVADISDAPGTPVSDDKRYRFISGQHRCFYPMATIPALVKSIRAALLTAEPSSDGSMVKLVMSPGK